MARSPLTVPNDNDADAVDDASTWTDRQASGAARRAAVARNRSGRRRMVDPATCERDYSQAEVEFMKAMQAFKTASGRAYPSWGEVLQVIQGLGYQKFETTETPSKPTAAD